MARKVTQADFVKTALRLPPELHAKVHEFAQASGRTYNAQLITMLQDYIEREQEAAEAIEHGIEQENAVGVSYGLTDPLDRAAVLKVLLFPERTVLRQRVAELGGKDAVLQLDDAEIKRRVTGPRITGTDAEKRSHMSRALETFPLTTLLTDDELEKLAERVITIQKAMGQLK